MFKKLLNKFIMNTECYLLLKNRLKEIERENQEIIAIFGIESLTDKITNKKTYRSSVLCTITKNLEGIITHNKTTARKIKRTVNALIRKEDSVRATNDIKVLCDQIIKGE